MYTAVPSEDTRYAFAVGRVRAREARLFDRARWDRLVQAASNEELVRLLADTPYAQFGFDDFERMLHAARLENLEFFERYCVDPWLWELVQAREDFYNARLAVKCDLARQDASPIFSPLGRYPLETLKMVIEGQTDKVASGLYRGIMSALAAWATERDPVLVDTELDRAMLAEMVRLARPNAFLEQYYRLVIDWANLRTIVRLVHLDEPGTVFERAFIPGGDLAVTSLRSAFGEELAGLPRRLARTPHAHALETGIAYLNEQGSFLRLERRAEEAALDFLLRARRFTFGPEPLVGYFLLKEHEIRGLRKLHVGKASRLAADQIRESIPHAR